MRGRHPFILLAIMDWLFANDKEFSELSYQLKCLCFWALALIPGWGNKVKLNNNLMRE